MTKDEVLHAIHIAFQDERYPGDEHLAGQVSQCPSEYSYVADYFKGKHWKETRCTPSNWAFPSL